MFIGLLVGGFDLSAGTAQAIKVGFENGISRRTSFVLLGLCQLLTLVSTYFFLPKHFIKKPLDADTIGTGSLQECIERSRELKKPEKLPPLRSLILSPTYLLHLYWTAVLQLRYMFIMSSLNVTLQNLLPSKQEVSQYTNITAYILLFGAVTSPMAGAIIDSNEKRFRGSLSPLRRKLMPTVLPLAFGTTFGIALSAVILAETAAMVCLVFIMMVIMRSFIYTLLSGLLLAVYPNEYYGFMLGIILMVCGAVNLLQSALFAWASAVGFEQVPFYSQQFCFVFTGILIKSALREIKKC
ncbi:solute carrier family 43 member 3 [Elysia marginata]|uniref:Solute carrier family 43 member 3 n=1 Tax=Elysia marginata TaxID=1093978 RepID=A0AAV4GFI4_9GAST|nr:solute carrier family 43 member 3 [Elysia marginata]